jgi:hypothetical protein
MAAVKDCYALVSYYEKKFKEKYGTANKVNKFSARWGFDAMLQDMTVPEVQALLDYYFLTPGTRRHDLTWFFYNYDSLEVAKGDHDKDSERQARIRAESAERAKKWRERGNKRGIGNQLSPEE